MRKPSALRGPDLAAGVLIANFQDGKQCSPHKVRGGMHQENLKDLDERETEIMPSTRETAQKYIDFIAALKFAEAFEMLASDAKYRIIGKTPLSKTYSRADLLNVLVPALAEFKQPPTLTFQELIVEGNRAVALASGHGISPAGLPYDQLHYAMILRIENGAITGVVEFMDTVEIETQIIGRKFVA